MKKRFHSLCEASGTVEGPNEQESKLIVNHPNTIMRGGGFLFYILHRPILK